MAMVAYMLAEVAIHCLVLMHILQHNADTKACYLGISCSTFDHLKLICYRIICILSYFGISVNFDRNYYNAFINDSNYCAVLYS